MALMRTYYFSPLLKQHTTLTVAWPEEIAPPYRLVYLLHGGTDDATSWFRESDVEALCHRHGVMAVSFDARSSSYADMVHGQKFFTYLTQELPAFLQRTLPVSTRREDTCIAGFSMGGQGAMKAAFRCPELYGAAMGLSGARDTVCLYQQWAKMENGPDLGGVEDALGPIDKIYGSENDILFLAEEAAKRVEELPAIYISCGEEDYAVELSRAYDRHLTKLGIPHDYYETSGPHGYASAWAALDRALGLYFKGVEA